MCATKPVYSHGVVEGRVVFTSTGARVSCYMEMSICQRGPLYSKRYEAWLSTTKTMVEIGWMRERLCLG